MQTTQPHTGSAPVPERAPRVLVVGQSSPGGIATFIGQLLGDPWLRERVELEYLNTMLPEDTRPGSLTAPNVRLALRYAFEIYRRARTVDAVHLNMAAAPVLPLLRAATFSMAAKVARAKVILHAHTGRIELAMSHLAYRTLLRMVLRLVDVMVVVSRSAEATVWRIAPNVRRLENGIDVAPFRTGPKTEDPPIVLFVGTVCERKGLIDLRDALVSLRQRNGGLPLRVLIAGDGKQEGPGAFERVKQAYDESGLTEVAFLGEVAPDRVSQLLAETSIFCLPSHWEGFPLSVLEAMASEAAVVATEVGDVSFILDHGRAGFVVRPHDPLALADALGRLIRDPEERARLGRLGRARVEREFGEPRISHNLHSLYVSLGQRFR